MNKELINTGRYHRQLILSEIGVEGQWKLLKSKVLVVGAGGLGCAVLPYLVAAGVGNIGIVDDDFVSIDNLHRQVLYSVDDIGLIKAKQAKAKLDKLNPEIEITAFCERLKVTNALNLFSDYHIIIDCTDNFASRYLINDACVLLGKPMIYGAVSQHEGQLAVFNYRTELHDHPVNYRDLFPDYPKDNEVLNCEEAGVLGVLPGIIGVMQAAECIKLIIGYGKPLVNVLLHYNCLNNHFYEISLIKNQLAHRTIPFDEESFKNMDYEWLCTSVKNNFEIDVFEFNLLIKNKATTLVDVRQPDELPKLTEFKSLNIPLSQIRDRADEISGDTVILFCQSGRRSLLAARQLSALFGSSKLVYSLKGGVMNLLQHINEHAS